MIRFEEMYRDSSIQNALPFAMNSDFSVVLKEEMVRLHLKTFSLPQKCVFVAL